MIPTLTISNETNNIIQAFFRIFQMFTTLKALYFDCNSYFDNQKLRNFLSSRNMIVVYASNSSHKSRRQIEKANNILSKAFKKM